MILFASTNDDDEDYQRIRDEGLTNNLNSLEMGLVLASQPLGLIEDLTRESNMVGELTTMEISVTAAENLVDPILDTEVDLIFPMSTVSEGEIEIGGVGKTLEENLANSRPSVSKTGPSKTIY